MQLHLRRLFVVALLFISGFTPLAAQTFRAAYPGKGIVNITGPWAFHTGDDPHWADPLFPDATWEHLTANATWGAQTHPGYTGFAWYRRTVEVDGVHGSLSLAMPLMTDLYELFWNGHRIASHGTLPPHARLFAKPSTLLVDLPPADATGTLRGVLAIRVWTPLLYFAEPPTMGGLPAPPRVGDTTVLNTADRLHLALVQQKHLPAMLESFLEFAVGLVILSNWIRNRRDWANLWLGWLLLSYSLEGVFFFSGVNATLSLRAYTIYFQVVQTSGDLALWMLLLVLFDLTGSRRWRRITVGVAALAFTVNLLDTIAVTGWEHAGRRLWLLDAVTAPLFALLSGYVLLLLVVGLWHHRNPELWPLGLSAGLLSLFLFLINGAEQLSPFFGFRIDNSLINGPLMLHLGRDYIVSGRESLTALLLLTLLWTVSRRQARQRARQTLLEAEVQSAKEIQRVLVPEAVAPVPGYAISTLYWPAAEVGGDLFQILPDAEGNVLVILGDVSGKGLKAAMTVALIVGTVRTLAEISSDPAFVLNGLNRRLLGRTGGGFATCLGLLIRPDGTGQLVNAGHLPPFLNGEELPMAGELPLGLTSDVNLKSTALHLLEGDDLTLYTDGVLEARNKGGELFGFTRLRDLLRTRPAVQTIAETARAFGQEDDITALRITRVPLARQPEQVAIDLQTLLPQT